MRSSYKGRVIVPGELQAEVLKSTHGVNILSSYQKSLILGDKTAKCSDQENPDLLGKPIAGRALCLPQAVGATMGGLVLYCVAELQRQPACLLFENEIDCLSAAGTILADIWTEHPIPTIDRLGEEFMNAIETGCRVSIQKDGTVIVE